MLRDGARAGEVSTRSPERTRARPTRRCAVEEPLQIGEQEAALAGEHADAAVDSVQAPLYLDRRLQIGASGRLFMQHAGTSATLERRGPTTVPDLSAESSTAPTLDGARLDSGDYALRDLYLRTAFAVRFGLGATTALGPAGPRR